MLLIVPLSNGCGQVTELQRAVCFVAYLCATIASVFLMAPTAYHRRRWREHDKEQMLETSNRQAIAGTAFLAAGMAATVFLITDVLFAARWAAVVTAIAAAAFGWLWYGLPLLRRMRDNRT